MIGIAFGVTTLARTSLMLISVGKPMIPRRVLVKTNGRLFTSSEAVRPAKLTSWTGLLKRLSKKLKNTKCRQ